MTGRKIATLAAILLMAGFMTSCTLSPEKQLEETGLFGEHCIVRVEHVSTSGASMSGGFFLIAGVVDGSYENEPKLRFYWEANPNQILATTLSYYKFQFVIDNEKEMPTIEFMFDENWLQAPSITERSFSEKNNLNSWVMSPDMLYAIVRISEETLENEIYLPRVK